MTSLVVLAGLLMAGPSLYAALTGAGDVDTALLHLVLGLVLAAVGGHVVRYIVRGYEHSEHAAAGDEAPGRRRTDLPDAV
ncbi:hypothetical protein NUM3379_01320 [Kineococcus sp. NUM-3379]